MDFSFGTLRPGDKVIWNGTIEKVQHDSETRPAPPLLRETRPVIRGRNRDAETVASLRKRWGVEAANVSAHASFGRNCRLAKIPKVAAIRRRARHGLDFGALSTEALKSAGTSDERG